MKKTILALVLSAGLTSFAGNAKADIITANLNETATGNNYIGFGFKDGSITSDYNYGIDGSWDPGFEDPWGSIGFQNGQYNGSKYYVGSNDPLSFGTTIDSSLRFTGGNGWYVGVNNNTSGYWGVAFSQGNGNYNYGWVEVTMNDSGLTFGQAAVETTANLAITAGAGAVPEPSTYALFGLGALALIVAYRRKVA